MSTSPSQPTARAMLPSGFASRPWAQLARSFVIAAGFAVIVVGGLVDIAQFIELRDADTTLAGAVPVDLDARAAGLSLERATDSREVGWSIRTAPLSSVFLEPAIATYTVVPGDVLYEVAVRHGITSQALIELNGIADPDRIEVGQVLMLPEPGS